MHATWQSQEPPNTTPSQECLASSNIFLKSAGNQSRVEII